MSLIRKCVHFLKPKNSCVVFCLNEFHVSRGHKQSGTKYYPINDDFYDLTDDQKRVRNHKLEEKI